MLIDTPGYGEQTADEVRAGALRDARSWFEAAIKDHAERRLDILAEWLTVLESGAGPEEMQAAWCRLLHPGPIVVAVEDIEDDIPF